MVAVGGGRRWWPSVAVGGGRWWPGSARGEVLSYTPAVATGSQCITELGPGSLGAPGSTGAGTGTPPAWPCSGHRLGPPRQDMGARHRLLPGVLSATKAVFG